MICKNACFYKTNVIFTRKNACIVRPSIQTYRKNACILQPGGQNMRVFRCVFESAHDFEAFDHNWSLRFDVKIYVFENNIKNARVFTRRCVCHVCRVFEH